MFDIPKEVIKIAKTLESNGFECFIVGGAVRDHVMGRKPHDWDLTTNATPRQVSALMHSAPTGIKFGTVTAYGCEITTYRKETAYSDGRHPDGIEYAERIEEDLARRDFTFNAMAMDLRGNIIDPFDGQRDLEKGLIRAVGSPDSKFQEDALRMLRALRFSAQFGFDIDKDTKEAIVKNCSNIDMVSAERKREEMTKLLMSDRPGVGLELAHETGVLGRILPEFDRCFDCKQNNPYHTTDVAHHSIMVVENLERSENLRWAALLHDIGKPDAKILKPDGLDGFYGHPEISFELALDICERLKFSNRDKAEITLLVKEHDITHKTPRKVRQFAGEYGKDFVEALHKLQVADARAHNPEYLSTALGPKQEFYEKCMQYITDGTAIRQEDLKINGNELQEIGIIGPKIKLFKDYIYRQCLGQPSLNTNEQLRRQAQVWHNQDLRGVAPTLSDNRQNEMRR